MKTRLASLFLALCVVLTVTAGAAGAAVKERGDSISKQWESLSKKEKNQVYDLLDERAKIEMALLDKYVELGLMDESRAGEMRDHISRRFESMRENGVFPGAGRGPREESRKTAA